MTSSGRQHGVHGGHSDAHRATVRSLCDNIFNVVHRTTVWCPWVAVWCPPGDTSWATLFRDDYHPDYRSKCRTRRRHGDCTQEKDSSAEVRTTTRRERQKEKGIIEALSVALLRRQRFIFFQCFPKHTVDVSILREFFAFSNFA